MLLAGEQQGVWGALAEKGRYGCPDSERGGELLVGLPGHRPSDVLLGSQHLPRTQKNTFTLWAGCWVLVPRLSHIQATRKQRSFLVCQVNAQSSFHGHRLVFIFMVLKASRDTLQRNGAKIIFMGQSESLLEVLPQGGCIVNWCKLLWAHVSTRCCEHVCPDNELLPAISSGQDRSSCGTSKVAPAELQPRVLEEQMCKPLK